MHHQRPFVFHKPSSSCFQKLQINCSLMITIACESNSVETSFSIEGNVKNCNPPRNFHSENTKSINYSNWRSCFISFLSRISPRLSWPLRFLRDCFLHLIEHEKLLINSTKIINNNCIWFRPTRLILMIVQTWNWEWLLAPYMELFSRMEFNMHSINHKTHVGTFTSFQFPIQWIIYALKVSINWGMLEQQLHRRAAKLKELKTFCFHCWIMTLGGSLELRSARVLLIRFQPFKEACLQFSDPPTNISTRHAFSRKQLKFIS